MSIVGKKNPSGHKAAFDLIFFFPQGEISVQEPHVRSPTQLLLSLPLSQDHPRHRGKTQQLNGFQYFAQLLLLHHLLFPLCVVAHLDSQLRQLIITHF